MCGPLMVRINHMQLSLAGDGEAFRACRPAEGFRLISLVQFNEVQYRFIEFFNGFVAAAPDPLSPAEDSIVLIIPLDQQY